MERGHAIAVQGKQSEDNFRLESARTNIVVKLFHEVKNAAIKHRQSGLHKCVYAVKINVLVVQPAECVTSTKCIQQVLPAA